METLTLIEHESLPIRDNRARGDRWLGTEQVTMLEKLEKRFSARPFSWGARSVKFAQYCGIISLGNLTLEILPKIYGKEKDPGACRQALIRMLHKARILNTLKGGTAEVALQRHCLLEVFILHFCDMLYAELTQGMIRQYVTRDENLPVLRGRLRIEKQFKKNLAHRERLHCRYDELSADNDHNRAIKYVLRLLLKLSSGVTVRKQLSELLMRFDEITNVMVNVVDLDRLRFDRVTTRYEPIINQCRWFLQGFHPAVTAGDNACLTLLFDMNRLFESYVAATLRKIAGQRGLKMREQGPRKCMVEREEPAQQLFVMKPDMVFIDEKGSYVAIADAKWKILDESEKKMGISQGDLYQIASYATRYEIDKLALIYPMHEGLTEPVKFNLLNTSATVRVVPLDVNNKAPADDLSFWECDKVGTILGA